MKPKINFITLSVNDLNQSVEFYPKVFNFPVSEQSENLCLFELEDDFHLAIESQDDFALQIGSNSKEVMSAGFILSHQAQSEQEVNEIVKLGEDFGSKRIKTFNEDWGYSVTLKDINGHHWEIVFFKNN